MPSMVDAALWYAEQMNWLIIPLHTPDADGVCSCSAGPRCKSAGKHPRVEHLKDASRDLGQIKDWWREWPDANVGIAVGEESGVIVIDVDPRNGGRETLKELIEDFGPVPNVLTAKTGGGGRHFYCAYSEEPTVYKPGKGIEIKAKGLVVAAPSHHESGAAYQWVKKPNPATTLPELPQWCLDESSSVDSEGKARRKSRTPKAPVVLYSGERDDMLISYAGRWRRAGMEEPQLYAALSSLNSMWGEPPKDDDEVRRIARSAARYPTFYEELQSKDEFEIGDKGHAERFLAKYGDDLKWAPGLGWMIWDGAHWKADSLKQRRRLAYYVGDSIREEFDKAKDEKHGRQLEADARYADSERGVSNMLASAEALSAVDDTTFDANPWLLNVQNGTIDLRTGSITPHARTDFLTKIAPVFYQPKAKAPRFLQFMDETFMDDASMVAYMRRLLGYCMTGDVREQIFPVFWGPTRNGKSTLNEHVIRAVLGGDYVTSISSSLLVEKKLDNSETSTAVLRARRVAIAVESGKRRLDEEMIKRLTGNDTLRARHLYHDAFEFRPTHKIILVTNEKPRTSNSAAIWRRIQLVPFENELAPADWDLALGEKLEAESSGILNWLIDGCLEWQLKGLQPPPKVLMATEEQRVAEDYLGLFISEALELGPKMRCTVSDLYDAYLMWANQNGVRPYGKIGLSKELLARKLKIERFISSGIAKWRGVKPLVVMQKTTAK